MQRRWAVAFATMFALSLLTAATSFVAITRLVDTFRDAAVRVDRETAETVRLRAMVEEEWNAAHSLVDQQPHSAAGSSLRTAGSRPSSPPRRTSTRRARSAPSWPAA